jgi:hypothetical protein
VRRLKLVVRASNSNAKVCSLNVGGERGRSGVVNSEELAWIGKWWKQDPKPWDEAGNK